MRILIAIGVPRQKEAGAAAVVLNHARELEKRGHTVECWFLDDVLRRPARPKRLEALIFAARLAKRILRERSKFDVVNLHAPCGWAYGLWCQIFRPAGAPPYAVTMQGSEERYVETMRREQRKGRALNFRWKNRVWHRLYHQTMYDYSIKTAGYGALANRDAWTCAELKFHRALGHFRFVPNGTEECFFAARDYSDTMPMRLLFVGSWLDRKGIFYLADALRLLIQEAAPVKLTVAGCGVLEEEVRQSFAPEIRGQVRVLPFVSRSDMPSLYAGHDIFVFPSLIEGMPLALLEAMASGMPVVTTETAGMADIVEDGFNGLLVPPVDAPSLTAAITKFCGSAALRRQLGREAQNTMRRYTWERVTRKLEQVLSLAADEETRN